MSEGDVRTYDNWAECYDFAEDDRAAMIGFYGSLISRSVTSILELGCGTGTILMALAQRIAARDGSFDGARIAGVDESRNMLELARRKDERFELILGDMRVPPVEGNFDLIICNYNTLQLCTSYAEVRQTFRSVRDLLTREGVFAFDLYQPNLTYLSLKQCDRLVRRVVDASGKEFELREDASYDATSSAYTISWRLHEPGSDKENAKAYLRFRYFQYSAADVQRALHEAGLVIRERFGELDKSPFGIDSKKQVVVSGLP